MPMTEIVITKKMSFSGYRLIEGFPGIGLIGTIAASFIAETNHMDMVGYIASDKFPPMASIRGGIPIPPVRVYADKKNKLLVVFSDFVIPSNLVNEVTNALLDFARKNRIEEVISLAGMTSPIAVDDRKIYAIASSNKVKEKLEKYGVVFIEQGVTTGISGMLLMKSAITGFPAFSLLVETTAMYPDPGAAAVLLRKLGEYLGMPVKTELLEEEAKRIHERIQRTMEQVRAGKMKYKQAEEHLPMYG